MKASIFLSFFFSTLVMAKQNPGPGPAIMTINNTNPTSFHQNAAIAQVTFQVTEPVEETTYKFGEAAKLSWANGFPTDLVIDIVEGDDTQAMQAIGWNAHYAAVSGPGSYDIPITSTFETNKTYCFKLSFVEAGENIDNYSHTFKVSE